MSAWGEFATQASGALLGTIVGGVITVLVVRWQTLRTLDAQVQLAASQERAAARLARNERAEERASDAARLLLERLADLYSWMPSLPDVGADHPRLSEHARQRCREALKSVRRGVHTELMSIASPDVRERYRTLVRLAYDVGYRGIGAGRHERQIRDVRNYLRYVGHSLEAVIDGRELPPHAEPPALDRNGTDPWEPPFAVPYWEDPADGS